MGVSLKRINPPRELKFHSFTGDGSTTDFVLTTAPMTDGEMVFRGGALQKSGIGNDYTISGANVSFVTAPTDGINIEVRYFTN